MHRVGWLAGVRKSLKAAGMAVAMTCLVSGCGTSVPPTAQISGPKKATPAAEKPAVEKVVAEKPGVEKAASNPVAAKPATAPKSDKNAPANGKGFVGLEAQENEAQRTQNRRQLIEEQIAAGEIGPALETAVATFDKDERTELLKLVAAAQRKAGDFEAARTTSRLLPRAGDRVAENGQRASEEMLAGGSFANFQPLINLIQQETSGPWQAIDGDGGTISQFQTGVKVDPNGLLSFLTKQDHEGQLNALGIRARQADLNTDIAKSTELRIVSLARLEHEISKRLASGKPVLETMKQFAGLTSIQYVFVDRQNGDVLVGGPAEGWRYNTNGNPVGAETGRPTLQLDDFVTVVRTFHEGGMGAFDCLIVPREEGLKALKAFVAQSNAKGPISAGAAVKNWVNQMQQKLGLQDIQVHGVPTDSRVARVIVEADYRMKLIGIGKLEGGKEVPSYFELLNVNASKDVPDMDALRWWLTMKYEAILHSPDRSVFEIQGSAVKCQSENELITAEGKRIHTGKAEATNRLFAQNFTAGYSKLAERDPIFADMQNIFDLSLVSAILAKERKEHALVWTPGVFGQGGSYVTAKFDTPMTVMSVVNHKVYNGKDIVVQVAGGVRGDFMTVVNDASVRKETPRLANFSEKAKAPKDLAEGRWWWDAAK